MKRRAFFGFAGGAAIAGPAVAKAAVAELPKGIAGSSVLGNMPMGGPYAQAVCYPSSGDWKIKEIANLRRFLSGDLTDEEKEQEKRRRLYTLQNTISQNVGGLKSVSGVHKLRMYDDQYHCLNDRIRRSESKGYLSRLLGEVGR